MLHLIGTLLLLVIWYPVVFLAEEWPLISYVGEPVSFPAHSIMAET